jgi:hypothetical protein
VWAEASTVLRAVEANFFCNCSCLYIPSDNRIRHVPKFRPLSCSKLSIGNLLLYWKWKPYPRVVFRMSGFISVCTRRLLLVESSDLRPRNQYSLVRAIPNGLRFVKICLCEVSLVPRCSPRFFTYFKGKYTLFIRTGGHVRIRAANRFGSVNYSPFCKPVSIATRMVCRFCKATLGSLSVASAAVSVR